MNSDRLKSELVPATLRRPRGPVLPWEVTCVLFGCEWLLETTWSEHDERWEVWVGCEGVKVGSLYLAAREMSLRLVDPEGLIPPSERPFLERRLEEELCERVWRMSDSARAGAVQSLIEQGLSLVVLPILRGCSDTWARRRYASLRARLEQAGVDVPDCREDIEDAIAVAFAAEAMPVTEDALTPGGIDGPYVIDHYFGKDRGEIEDDFIPSLHIEDFTYMTPQAVRYYLPAPLRLALREADSELWLFLHGFLKRAFKQDELTREQKRVVARWAQYLARRWLSEPDMLKEANEASALAESYQQQA